MRNQESVQLRILSPALFPSQRAAPKGKGLLNSSCRSSGGNFALSALCVEDAHRFHGPHTFAECRFREVAVMPRYHAQIVVAKLVRNFGE